MLDGLEEWRFCFLVVKSFQFFMRLPDLKDRLVVFPNMGSVKGQRCDQ